MTKRNYITQEKKIKVFTVEFGAVEESRTPTPVKVLDPESSASANSATTAHGYFTIKAVSLVFFFKSSFQKKTSQ
jgi:hypothetical protein